MVKRCAFSFFLFVSNFKCLVVEVSFGFTIISAFYGKNVDGVGNYLILFVTLFALLHNIICFSVQLCALLLQGADVTNYAKVQVNMVGISPTWTIVTSNIGGDPYLGRPLLLVYLFSFYGVNILLHHFLLF